MYKDFSLISRRALEDQDFSAVIRTAQQMAGTTNGWLLSVTGPEVAA
jgi:hypothetical protein